MKCLLMLLADLCLTVTAACAFASVDDAVSMIRDGKAECVIIRSGKICYVEHGHGVSPLLNIYESHREEMSGATVVDKVIGRAAAAIAICGRAKHVHGEVMSEDAVIFLRTNGITFSYSLLVPRILNQKRDGLCPLEKSVEGITKPEEALVALKKKIVSMQGSSAH